MTLLALAACTMFEPQLQLLDEHPRLVEVGAVQEVATGVRLATDVEARADGGFWLLDSLGGALVTYDAAGAPASERIDAGLSATLRAAPAVGGGFWLVVPEADGLARIGADGAPGATLKLGIPEPLAVLDLGEELVVGTRAGRLAWVDPGTGAPRHTLDRGADGEPLGAIADLARLSDGTVVAVDTLRARVHLVSPTGQPASWFGTYGTFIGDLAKPKAVVAGPGDTLLIADSAIGGLQLFDRDGTALGAIGRDGAPLRVPHALALASSGDRFHALEAVTGRVLSFTVDPAAVEAARAAAGLRHLRHPIAPPDGEAALCLQCHDGILRDGRPVWAGGLAHPVDDGEIVCTTCHSPHPAATGDADTFLRARKEDLCVGCHELAPHGPAATAHPVDVEGSCLGCHAVHGAASAPLLRASMSWEACAGCHQDQAGADDHPVGRTVALGATGLPTLSGEQGCADCHDLVGGSPGGLVRAGLDCATCHAPASGGHEGRCRGCHDVHDAAAEPQLKAAWVDAGCTGCHTRPTAGHPVSACADCHDPHDPTPDAGCAGCHEDHRPGEGPHGALPCLDCHPAHDAPPAGGPADANPAARRCLACHAPAAPGTAPRVTSWRHPAAVFTPEGERWQPVAGLTLYDPAGAPTPAGRNGDLVCESCHAVHGDPDGLRDGWKDACSSCHGPEALMLYRWFHRPDRRSGP